MAAQMTGLRPGTAAAQVQAPTLTPAASLVVALDLLAASTAPITNQAHLHPSLPGPK